MPMVEVHVPDGLRARGDAGIGNHDVELSERGEHLATMRSTCGHSATSACTRECLAPHPLDLGHRLSRRRFIAAEVDRHVGALTREIQRDAAPDAARATGHQRKLAVEFAHRPILIPPGDKGRRPAWRGNRCGGAPHRRRSEGRHDSRDAPRRPPHPGVTLMASRPAGRVSGLGQLERRARGVALHAPDDAVGVGEDGAAEHRLGRARVPFAQRLQVASERRQLRALARRCWRCAASRQQRASARAAHRWR